MTLRLVFRYRFSPANRHRGRTLRIMLGLALSTVLMLCVISIMDALQDGRMDAVREVRSFPVTVSVQSLDEALWLEERYGDVAKVFHYKEQGGLLSTSTDSRGVVVRYIDGSYDFSGIYAVGEGLSGVLLPYGQSVPMSVSLTTLEEGNAVRMAPRSRDYAVSGLFQSRLGDFNSLYVFAPLDSAPEGLEYTVAFKDLKVGEEELASSLEAEGYGCTFWWQRESILHSALQLEKVVMTLLLSSLYIIVFVQIVQSALMLSHTKRRECASLALMGMTKRRLCLTFGLLGALMCIIAMVLGFVLSAILLAALPHMLPSLSLASFAIDPIFFLILCVCMTLLSALGYMVAFALRLREDEVLEVLNAV